MSGLSVSRLINVAVNLSPALARFPNFNTCLVLTDTDAIDTQTRMLSFSTLTAVGDFFGSDGPEYAAAQLWFGQKPSPTSILIGRWCKTAAAGELVGGALSAANQLIAAWNAINNGAFKITIDGVGPQAVGGLDFSASANLNAVADVIESGLPGGTATCTYDATNHRFVITSASTGAASSISFLEAPAAGTDIHEMMAGTAALGAFEANGVDAETALAAVTLFDTRFSNQFYGLVIPQATDDDHEDVASYVEGVQPYHFYGVNSQDGNTLVAGNTTCIAARLFDLEVKHTAVQYSASSGYAIMSLLARILTTNWQANNSTITLMYKDEPLVEAEVLNDSQMDALLAKNCNVFVEYNNDTAIIQPGITPSGIFVDSVIGSDWLAQSVQVACYNVLFGTPTKIPQTDAGMHVIGTAITGVLDTAVSNGLLAPGTWNSQGVGNVKQGDFLPLGYYLYQPPIATQDQADRALRKSVPFQALAKLGGAVHTVDISIAVES